MGTGHQQRQLRPTLRLRQSQSWRYGGHGNDGEAGWLGPARHHHDRATRLGPSRFGGALSAHWPQMVLLRADERPVSDARANRDRAVLLPRHWLAGGRVAQPVEAATAEGQV